jgi:YVTN family beta-propeller protein
MSSETGLHALPRRAHRAASSRLVAIGVGLILAACGDDGPLDPSELVESVDVSATSSTELTAIGVTLQLAAMARDADGNPVTGVDFEWSSSDETVATVAQNGLVTAVSNGSATISAIVRAASGSIPVDVEQVAAEIVFSVPPDDSSVGKPLGIPEVELLDANGHVVEIFSDAVTVSIGVNPRGGSLGGPSTSTAVDGVATFMGLSLDEAGAGYTLLATAGAVSGESPAFNVTRPSIYVGDYGAASSLVTVIDLATRGVLGTVPVGSRPAGVALTPDGLFAYVTNSVSNAVSVIETPGNTVVQTISLEGPDLPRMSPDGQRVYVARGSSDEVSVIETGTHTVVATIPVGRGPYGIGFTPDGELAYVANGNGESVSVIETAGDSVVATVTVGLGPTDVAVTPDGEKVYVTNAASDDVSVISTATNAVIATIPVGDNASLAAVTPDGSAVFVANFGSDDVSRIETATDAVSATIPVGDGPFALAAGPAGQFVYVANVTAGTIAVIDVANNAVVATIIVGGRPGDLAVMPEPK